MGNVEPEFKSSFFGLQNQFPLQDKNFYWHIANTQYYVGFRYTT